jgi:hypothetical protein
MLHTELFPCELTSGLDCGGIAGVLEEIWLKIVEVINT